MRNRPAPTAAPLALQALANHIVDAHLPTPASITPPDELHPDLVVWVRRDHVDLWLDSGFEKLNAQPVPRISQQSGHRTVLVDGTIDSPIGLVRIRLSYVEQAVRVMHMVAGGAS